MTGRDTSLRAVGLTSGAGLIAVIWVLAYVMGWLPWEADGVIAAALALGYTYGLDRRLRPQRERVTTGKVSRGGSAAPGDSLPD
jgi:hypothetical protein